MRSSTICEVIFGIPTNEEHYTQLINYIISKWYINKNNEQGKPLFFIELLGVLKAKIDSITFLNTLKFRNYKNWQSLLLDLLNKTLLTNEKGMRQCVTIVIKNPTNFPIEFKEKETKIQNNKNVSNIYKQTLSHIYFVYFVLFFSVILSFFSSFHHFH